jgi:dephospho-CoA kinase
MMGGIASGKTTVCRLFEEFGAEVVDADLMAHQVLESPAVKTDLVAWLGREILAADGRVNRAAVADRVFRDRAQLERLEAMVHPEVLRRIDERIERHERTGAPGDILILDVPLLLGTPIQKRCRRLVYVQAPRDERMRRAANRGWSEKDLIERERFQPSEEEKRGSSDFVINNAGEIEETRRQVEECFERLRQEARQCGSSAAGALAPRGGA